MVIEALEKAYRSTRGAVERTVGGVMFDLGNRMALSGHERIAWPFIHYGATMKMYSSLPHTPLRFNPAILNPDGSLNIQAFSEGLRRGRSHPGEDDQALLLDSKMAAR